MLTRLEIEQVELSRLRRPISKRRKPELQKRQSIVHLALTWTWSRLSTLPRREFDWGEKLFFFALWAGRKIDRKPKDRSQLLLFLFYLYKKVFHLSNGLDSIGIYLSCLERLVRLLIGFACLWFSLVWSPCYLCSRSVGEVITYINDIEKLDATRR